MERSTNDEVAKESEDVTAFAAVAALADPTRRAIFDFVASRVEPVGRDEVAAGVGVAHHVARFHLDRLLAAGLLEAEFKRPDGKVGPGAGRPAKLYRVVRTEFAVSVPERRYDLAGSVLARAAAISERDHKPIREAIETAASDSGHVAGRRAIASVGRLRRKRNAVSAALDVLEGCGFVPRKSGDRYVLANCPFQALAKDEPEVVCRMNVAFVAAVLDEVGVRTITAKLDPAEGRCCVTIGP